MTHQNIGGIPLNSDDPNIFRDVGIRIANRVLDEILFHIPYANIVYAAYRVVDLIMGGIFKDGKKSSNKRNTYAALENMENVLKRLKEKNLAGAVNSFYAFTVHARNSSSIRAMFLTLGKPGVTAWNLVAGFLSIKASHLASRIASQGEKAFLLEMIPERVLILRDKDARFSVGETFITRQRLQAERDELHNIITSYMREAELDVVIPAMPTGTISPEASEIVRGIENKEIDEEEIIEILSNRPDGARIYEEVTHILASEGEAWKDITARTTELMNNIMGEPRARFQSLSRPGKSSPMDVGELINGLVDFIHSTDNAKNRNGLINFIRKTVTLLTFVLISRSGYIPKTRNSFILAKDDMEQILFEDFKLPLASVEVTLAPLPIIELPMGEISGDQVLLPYAPKYDSPVYLRPPSEAELVAASKQTALEAMNRIRHIRDGFPANIRQDAIFYWYILLLSQIDPAVAKLLFQEDTTFEAEECYDPLGTGQSQICQIVTYDQMPVINKLGTPSLETLFRFAYPEFFNLFFPTGITWNKYIEFLMDMSIWVVGDESFIETSTGIILPGLYTKGTEFNPGHLAMIIIMQARKKKMLPGIAGMYFSDAIKSLFNKIEADALQADISVHEVAALSQLISLTNAKKANLDDQIIVETWMVDQIQIMRDETSKYRTEEAMARAEVEWMQQASRENASRQAWMDMVYEGYGIPLQHGILDCLRNSPAYAEARTALGLGLPIDMMPCTEEGILEALGGVR